MFCLFLKFQVSANWTAESLVNAVILVARGLSKFYWVLPSIRTVSVVCNFLGGIFLNTFFCRVLSNFASNFPIESLVNVDFKLQEGFQG